MMKFIDDIVAGYQEIAAGYRFGRWRSDVLAHLRREGEEQGEDFLRGRTKDGKGKYVFDHLEEVKRREDEQYVRRMGLAGYLLYGVVHPLQSYRDGCDITEIILSEVRPI